VSIGALDEPVNGPRPQLFLSPAADGESNVPGWPDDLFLVGGTDQVIERLALSARNEVVVASHQVEQRAGDLAQIDDVPAQGHSVFRQQVLLEEVFRKFAIDLAGHQVVEVGRQHHLACVGRPRRHPRQALGAGGGQHSVGHRGVGPSELQRYNHIEDPLKLRAGRLSEIDAAAIAEEVDDVGEEQYDKCRGIAIALRPLHKPQARSIQLTEDVRRRLRRLLLADEFLAGLIKAAAGFDFFFEAVGPGGRGPTLFAWDKTAIDAWREVSKELETPKAQPEISPATPGVCPNSVGMGAIPTCLLDCGQ